MTTSTLQETIAKAIAAQKMGLDHGGENLPMDLWSQAIPSANAAIRAIAGTIDEAAVIKARDAIIEKFKQEGNECSFWHDDAEFIINAYLQHLIKQ